MIGVFFVKVSEWFFLSKMFDIMFLSMLLVNLYSVGREVINLVLRIDMLWV